MAQHLSVADLLGIVSDPGFTAGAGSALTGSPGSVPGAASAQQSESDEDLARRLGDQIDSSDDLLNAFYSFALSNGLVADPYNLESARAFFSQPEEQRTGGGGAAGRVQFESERLLQEEQAESLRSERKLSLASFMENLKELAFGRVRDKMELLQDVDKIRDARHAAAISALMDAAPFIIPPGLKHFPGLEPGGIGDVLGGRLGVNVPNLEIPRVELPLQQFVDAPLEASPGAISAALDPLTGTVQQPRPVTLPVG